MMVAVIVLFVAGLIVIFNLFGRNKAKEGMKKISFKDALPKDGDEAKKKMNLSDTVDYYHGKKGFILTEEIKGAKAILDETGRASEYPKTIAMSCVLSCIGIVVGSFFLNNIFAGVIMAVGLFMLPLWRLKLYRNKYRKYLAAQLESATSLITTSYIRNNDFVAAVEENMEQLPTLVKPYFQAFLAECRINPSVKNCVRNLRERVNEGIFKEWCETVIHTLDNSEMRESLLPICKKYSAVRIVQDEIDLETANAIMEYAIMMGIMILAYPMVWVLNKQWFAYYGTIVGKICITYTIFVLFFSIAKLVGVMQPVQYKK